MLNEQMQPKVNFTVAGRLRPLRQPDGMSCWATVATIMRSWQTNREETIEDVVASAGPRFMEILKSGDGLHHKDLPAFLEAMHLTAEPPMSFSVFGFERLLRVHGLLWIVGDEDPGPRFSEHARVLFGLHGDGNPDTTHAFLIDPALGTRVTEIVAVLQEKITQIGIGAIDHGESVAQIIHF